MNPIKTPQEMLYEQAGIPAPQHMAEGGQTMTPQQMLAMMLVHSQVPSKFAAGGIASKAIPAIMAYSAYPEAKETYDALANKDYGKAAEHGAGLADLGLSMANMPYWLWSTLLGSGSLGAATMDQPEEDPGLSGKLSKYLFNLGKTK